MTQINNLNQFMELSISVFQLYYFRLFDLLLQKPEE